MCSAPSCASRDNLIMPHATPMAMQAHLDAIGNAVAPVRMRC